jgi:glycerol 2-dehydrogenase (NADP+)
MSALPTSKVKAIGVANCSIKYLEHLLANTDKVPAVNQVENHPLLPQQDLVDFCKSKNIHVTAYSPFGSTGSPLFSDESIQQVAKKHSVGAGTVLLSYQFARGISALPKSVTPTRIEENMKLVALDDEDLSRLNAIHEKMGIKRFVYPPFGVNLGFPDKPEGKVMI